MMRNGYKWAMLLAALAATIGCDGSDIDQPQAPEENAPAAAEQAIVHGTELTSNQFSAAIVRKSESPTSSSWGGTACSGVVLRRTARATVVLTARRCVTVDGDVDGDLVAADNIRVTTAVAPGGWVTQADCSPVSSVTALPLLQTPIGAGSDMAVLVVGEPLTLSGSGRFAINLGPTDTFKGGKLSAYGYGSIADVPASRHGTLRVASGLVPASDYTTYFSMYNTYLSDAPHVGSGDAGGAITRYYASGASGGWYDLFGVISGHSTLYAFNVSIAGNWEWLQTKVGYVYLSHAPDMSSNIGCATSSPTEGASLVTGLTGDSARNRWTYYPSDGTLRLGGYCLYGSGSSATLRTCGSTDAYRWDLTATSGYLQISNRSLGTCLTSATTPGLSTCGSSSLRALFHTQS